MRIALLSYRSKTHCGGQGVYVRHLSRGLVELGHDVEVFSGQPYPEILDPRVRLTEVPSLEELGQFADPPLTKDAVAGRIRRLLSMADRKAKVDGIPDTESAVTPDRAHPFTAGEDFCLVHNGSLSNHNSLRRELKQAGLSFETENDSEVAASYLTWRMREGDSIENAIDKGFTELDGFFTFLIGTGARGQMIGEWPGLNVLDEDDNLRSTSDFRSVYCSLVEQWFGVDAARIAVSTVRAVLSSGVGSVERVRFVATSASRDARNADEFVAALEHDLEHSLPGLVGRGVLLDIARLHGTPWLDASTAIGPRDLEAAEARHDRLVVFRMESDLARQREQG